MIFLGNVISFFASLFMVYSGLVLKKDKIIYYQSIQMLLFMVSNLILGGITGALTNGFEIIRNILCYYNKLNFKWKMVIIATSIIFIIYFNNLGIVGYLPLISLILYTLFIDTKSVIRLKLVMIFVTVLWIIYSFYINSYVSIVFNVFTVISTVISMFRLKSLKK